MADKKLSVYKNEFLYICLPVCFTLMELETTEPPPSKKGGSRINETEISA